MQVKDVMTRDVTTIGLNATLEEAAAKMSVLDIGPLPVHDGETLVGVITDRDIIVRAIATGLDPIQARVSDALTPVVIYCFEDQDVSVAERLMEENQVRRLVVLDRDHQLAGIVSLADLARRTEDEAQIGHVVEAISEPPAADPSQLP
jgi:CBS domain-containing protein